MRRPLALRAEVLDRLHQARAEEHLPEPVDRHARRQRIVRVDEPAGEAEPVVRHPLVAAASDSRPGTPGADLLARLVVLAAEQHVRRRAASGISSITIVVGKLSIERARCSSRIERDRAMRLADRGRRVPLQEVARAACAACGRRPLARPAWPGSAAIGLGGRQQRGLVGRQGAGRRRARRRSGRGSGPRGRCRRRCATAPSWRTTGSARRAARASFAGRPST